MSKPYNLLFKFLDDSSSLTAIKSSKLRELMVTNVLSSKFNLLIIDLMTRNVHNLAADEVYDARRGVDNETSFINYRKISDCVFIRHMIY